MLDDSTNKMLMHNAEAHATGFIHKSAGKRMLVVCSMNLSSTVYVCVEFTHK